MNKDILNSMTQIMIFLAMFLSVCFCFMQLKGCGEHIADDSHYTKGFNRCEEIYVEKMKNLCK